MVFLTRKQTPSLDHCPAILLLLVEQSFVVVFLFPTDSKTQHAYGVVFTRKQADSHGLRGYGWLFRSGEYCVRSVGVGLRVGYTLT